MAIAGAWLLFADPHMGEYEAAAQRAKRLTSAHGIEIGIGSSDTFFVLPHGPKDARIASVEAQTADAESAATALDGVERALAQYPVGFVSRLVKAIFIAGELRVGGAKAGGTVGPTWIILAAPKRLGREGIFATSYIGVHHELSSFVLHREPSTLTEWERFMPPHWRFDTASATVIARGAHADPDPATGFLSAYGGTNPENDFNVYAEKIFTEPAVVVRLASAQPLIRSKLVFVTSVYARIDARIGTVFRNLGIP